MVVFNSRCCGNVPLNSHDDQNDSNSHHTGGGGQGGLNLLLLMPFNPGFCPYLLAFFRLQNIAQCCIIFPFSPISHHLGKPASRPLFSRLPYTSRPLPFSPWSPAPPPCPQYCSYYNFWVENKSTPRHGCDILVNLIFRLCLIAILI